MAVGGAKRPSRKSQKSNLAAKVAPRTSGKAKRPDGKLAKFGRGAAKSPVSASPAKPKRAGRSAEQRADAFARRRT